MAPGRTGMYFLARLIRLPMTFTGHALELFGRAALGADRLTGESLDRVFRESPPPPILVPVPIDKKTTPENNPDVPTEDATRNLEEPIMADNNLNDDMVKLIEYSIISLERRKERIVDHATDKHGKYGTPKLYLETGRVTGDGFSNARIADYVKHHCGKKKVDKLDLDSLRVYYNVVARWPQSSLKYEEKILDLEQEKVDLLREIRSGNGGAAG